jgi:DNA mismatch repair protein MutL
VTAFEADIQGLQFSVADNGCGMDESDLALAGLHFHTSKINTAVSASRLATYGFRGEALASIAECSSIEIISRTQQSTVQWKKVLLGGSELYCGPLTSNELRSSHGTAVNVSKFFYNLPLRRQAISANCSAELENVKCRLQRIALIHPNIQFSLIDSHSKSSIMQV